jgi:hypothetical protein
MGWEYLIVALLVAAAAGWSVRFVARAWRGQGGCGCGRTACEPAVKNEYACPKAVGAAGSSCPYSGGEACPGSGPGDTRNHSAEGTRSR